MSNQKITELSSLSQNDLDPANDLLLAVDVSNTSMSSGGTNVKISPKELTGKSVSDLVQTWNNSGTIFSGLKLNVTDTASDASSSLLDLQVGSSSKFKIGKDGTIYVNGSVFSGGSWGNITGTLSSQTDLQSALDAKLSLSGGLLTGALTIEGTGTTVLNVGRTGAPANGRLLEVVSDATYSNAGFVSILDTLHFERSGNSTWLSSVASSNYRQWELNSANLLKFNQATKIEWYGADYRADTNASDLSIGRDAADTLALRRSTNANRLNIYGTYTDASNYRRLYLSSTTAGAFTLGIEGAGTGASGNTLDLKASNVTQTLTTNQFLFSHRLNVTGQVLCSQAVLRNGSNCILSSETTNVVDIFRNDGITYADLRAAALTLAPTSLTGSSATPALDISQTWNTTGTPAALKLNITDTASNAASLLLDLQVGGSSKFKIRKDGVLQLANNHEINSVSSANNMRLAPGGLSRFFFGTDDFIGIGSASDVLIGRDVSDILAQRRATNTQTFRIYNTFTDASNYIRSSLSFATYSSAVHAQLAAEGAGTGATDIPFVITPRGAGALIAGPMPDGTAVGGNARGNHAVDLQKSRFFASRVASGGASVISGGSDNTASSYYSVVGGGAFNTASNDYATVAGGAECQATGSYSAVGGGNQNVASGGSSTIGGGLQNTASNYFSVVGGGKNNLASGEYSTIAGGGGGSLGDNQNTASANYSTIGGGKRNTASGLASVIGGGDKNTASGSGSAICGGSLNISSGAGSSILGGGFNEATTSYSAIIGGIYCKTTRYGEVGHSSGKFLYSGDAQHSMLVARRSTADATANVVLTLDGAAPSGTSNLLILPQKSTSLFNIKLSAYNDTDSLGAWWIIRGGIRRDGTNGTTLIGSLITESGSEGAMSGCVASVVANDTNETLEIRVTGLTGKNIRWVAVIDISQVSYGIV